MPNCLKKTKLFLLHFAGGNIYSYQFLKPLIAPYFEVIPLELPGRGRRVGKPLLKTKEEAVQDLLNQIEGHLTEDDTFLIFGHSLGATLGWLLVFALEKKELYPEYLVVTGNAGPNIGIDSKLSSKPQTELMKELKKLGGVPDEVFDNKDLLDFFEPIIRADLALAESRHNLPDDMKINTPLYVIMGDAEDDVNEIKNWRNYCTDSKELVLKGKHFFIYQHKEKIKEILIECNSQIII